MARHTPGPWTLTLEQHDTLGDAPRWFVRGCEIGLTQHRVVDLDERDDANARLIAAAPELLDALKELRLASLAYGEASDADMDAAFARLLQARNLAFLAIAKAEGR